MAVDFKRLLELVKQAKARATARSFKQSIEFMVSLAGIDLRKPENRISGAVELPHSTGKPVKVCVIASGPLATQAKKSGADLVLEKEDLDRMKDDKKRIKRLAKEYDFFIADGPLMPSVGKVLGFALGPRGKMPLPVPPTAAMDELLAKHRKLVRIQVKDQPAAQCRIGNETMPDEQIAENAQAVLNWLEEKLGRKSIKSVILKTSMGEAIRFRLK
jgi:large subunit ribosomal protein L1